MRNTHAYIPFLLWLQERCDTANDPLINEVSAEFPKCVGPLLPDCGEVSHRNSRGVIGFELIGRSVSERLVDSL